MNKDEVGWRVCDHIGAGAAAHAPGTQGVLIMLRNLRLSETSL